MSSNGTPSPSVKLPVYLDNHATTPLDPRVLEAMLPFFTSKFGNAASSSHGFGWEAAAAVEMARRQIATAIGAKPEEIVFTSGATESDNLAVMGVAEACRSRGNHIITAVSEHKAVLDSCRPLEKHGCRITWLPVQADGLIDLTSSATPSPSKPSWSPSWRPTTRLVCFSRLRRSAGSVASAAFSSTLTPFRPWARSHSMFARPASIWPH